MSRIFARSEIAMCSLYRPQIVVGRLYLRKAPEPRSELCVPTLPTAQIDPKTEPRRVGPCCRHAVPRQAELCSARPTVHEHDQRAGAGAGAYAVTDDIAFTASFITAAPFAI